MNLWQLDPRRSARWRSNRLLHAERTVRGFAWVRVRARSWWLRASWRSAVWAWVVLSLPLVGFFGHKAPDWVGTAWTVIGVPVALIVALLVFLLGTAAGQSLRTTAFYRAVIAKTGLIWPVVLSIVLLIWCGVIERFSTGGTSPPAFFSTWLLVLFAAEMVSVLAVFISLLSLAAPSRAADIVKEVFADSVRRTVENRLRRNAALKLLYDACQTAHVSFGLFGAGRAVPAGRTGWVHDIDLRLPATIASYAATAKTTLTVELGHKASPDRPIANIDGEVGRWLDKVIQNGVHVHRKQPAGDDPREVFSETLDLARRAMNDGGNGAMRANFDLIAECVEEVPHAYRVFGLDYTAEVTSEGLMPSIEQQMEGELSRFCRDVLVSGDHEAQYQLPGIALSLAMGGASADAPLLLQQGLRLWLTQLWIALDFGSDQVRNRLIREIPTLANHVVTQLQGRLQDESLPLTRRLSAVPLLHQVFRFQTRLLRTHIDAADVPAFRDTWADVVDWAPNWTPEHDVEDAEFTFSTSRSEHDRHSAKRALDTARAVSKAKAELTATRDWGSLMLGAWALQRYESGALDREAWEQLLAYIVGPFGSFTGLSDAISEVWDVDGPVKELENWELDDRLARSRRRTWVGTNARENVFRWAVLLLLRRTSSAAVPDLTLTGVDPSFFADKLREALSSVESEPQKWDVVVAGHLPEKAEQLRKAIDDSIDAARRGAAAEVAAAPISEAAVRDFASKQERAFAHRNRVRERLLRVGAVNIEETPAAFAQLGPGHLLDKRLFIGAHDHVMVINPDHYGRELAARQQAAAYLELVDLALVAPEATDPAVSILAAADELRNQT